MHQFPCRESRTLKQRPCFIDKDLQPPAPLMRQIDRRQRGSHPTRRQRTGIAMRQDIRAVGKHRETVLGDLSAHRAILFPDGSRFGVQPLPNSRRIAARLVRHVCHAMERPPQVDRGGTRVREQVGQLRDAREKGGPRRPPLLAHPGDEPHRGRDPDQRCAADLQLLDRLSDRFCALEITGDLSLGKRTLIDDPNGTRGRP